MARSKTTPSPVAVEKIIPETSPAASDMVTVAYNSPRGMEFKINGKTVSINGNAEYLRGREKGVIPVGRFGYTRIPAADWEAIVKTFGSMAIIERGLMFAEKTKDRAEDRAEEQAQMRHGLEPVNTEKTATKETKLGSEQ